MLIQIPYKPGVVADGSGYTADEGIRRVSSTHTHEASPEPLNTWGAKLNETDAGDAIALASRCAKLEAELVEAGRNLADAYAMRSGNTDRPAIVWFSAAFSAPGGLPADIGVARNGGAVLRYIPALAIDPAHPAHPDEFAMVPAAEDVRLTLGYVLSRDRDSRAEWDMAVSQGLPHLGLGSDPQRRLYGADDLIAGSAMTRTAGSFVTDGARPTSAVYGRDQYGRPKKDVIDGYLGEWTSPTGDLTAEEKAEADRRYEEERSAAPAGRTIVIRAGYLRGGGGGPGLCGLRQENKRDPGAIIARCDAIMAEAFGPTPLTPTHRAMIAAAKRLWDATPEMRRAMPEWPGDIFTDEAGVFFRSSPHDFSGNLNAKRIVVHHPGKGADGRYVVLTSEWPMPPFSVPAADNETHATATSPPNLTPFQHAMAAAAEKAWHASAEMQRLVPAWPKDEPASFYPGAKGHWPSAWYPNGPDFLNTRSEPHIQIRPDRISILTHEKPGGVLHEFAMPPFDPSAPWSEPDAPAILSNPMDPKDVRGW